MRTSLKRFPSAGPKTLSMTVLLAIFLVVGKSIVPFEVTGRLAHADAAPVGAITALALKEDARIDLDDAKPRAVRCVSRGRTTTCTGWPVAATIASR